ncbi:MAG: hypothetical protein Q4A83_03485 [Bacillota bacterium]|nr:hypothetical protein [Bacillota bacterium]
MKKEKYSLFLYITAALLVIGFAIRLGADYFYNYELGSSPFYLYIIERFAEFILPAIACIAAGHILKKKLCKGKCATPAIVYTSNAGHTKEYAVLLGSKSGLPVYDLKEARSALPKGSGIIYLGWVMAGTVRGCKKARKYFDIKALCGVGMTSGEKQYTDIRKANGIPAGLPLFTLQGGFEAEKLRGILKLMMQAARKGLEDKKDRTAEDEEMLELMAHGENRVSEDGLKDILSWYGEHKDSF